MEQRRKGLIFSIIVVLVIVFVFSLALIAHKLSLSAKITITAVPNVSTITINGSGAGQGINKVKPGVQKITVSYPGFTTYSETVTVNKGDNSDVKIALESNSNSTSNWYSTNPKDEKTAEGISSSNTDAIASQSVQNYPLIQLLPFVAGGLEFRVDYGNKPGAKAAIPAIYITSPTSQGQQDGLAWIRSLGYNPANYNIQYVTANVTPLNP